MSWLKNAFFSLRAAMNAAGSPTTITAGRRAVDSTIQTTARKSLVHRTSNKSGPGIAMTAEDLAWLMAWEKFVEQPSPHQRLAPYA